MGNHPFKRTSSYVICRWFPIQPQCFLPGPHLPGLRQFHHLSWGLKLLLASLESSNLDLGHPGIRTNLPIFWYRFFFSRPPKYVQKSYTLTAVDRKLRCSPVASTVRSMPAAINFWVEADLAKELLGENRNHWGILRTTWWTNPTYPIYIILYPFITRVVTHLLSGMSHQA